MNLEWTNPALESLHDIREYISNAAGPDVAQSVQTEIVLQVETLLEFPSRGRQVPRIDDPRIREIIVKSYRVIYELNSLHEPSEASILAVAHSAQQLKNTLLTKHLDL